MFDLGLDGAVARLTLARPEARNAIPLAGWGELAAAAERAAAAGARVLLLSGAGQAFCAGADIGDFAAMRGDWGAAAAFREAMADALARLARLPIPTIALVEGPCFGAGVALAMACDLRLAGPTARFAITPAKFGISYPQSDIARLVALVGPGQAAKLLMSARGIDAAEAERIGLVEGPAAAADELVAAILANSAESLEALKRGISLAAAGVARDAKQDRSFDALLAAEGLMSRIAEARGRR